MYVYHVVLPEVWDDFRGAWYEADSLATEGFIHCSFAEQLDGVLARYYSGEPRVKVLEIEPSKLISKLIVEPSTGGESYPHIYGPINREAIVAVKDRILQSAN
ncbi:MAG: DUF952 domain-containing protein [Pyrinomonadaceae bacterium]